MHPKVVERLVAKQDVGVEEPWKMLTQAINYHQLFIVETRTIFELLENHSFTLKTFLDL